MPIPVFKNVVVHGCVKTVPATAVVQLHLRKWARVEPDSLLGARGFEELIFVHKKTFSFGADETTNQPRTGNLIHHYVVASSPLH